ncbi:MAG: hypothetical protein U1F49_15860 [Rubrivivax sp.]
MGHSMCVLLIHTSSGEAGEVLHGVEVGVQVLRLHEPAEVRVPGSRCRWPATIGECGSPGAVGEAVVLAVVPGPPDRPALAAGRHAQAEQRLRDARGLERAVREVAVGAGLDEEHAHEVADDRGPVAGRHRHEEHAHAHRVRDGEAGEDDAVAFAALNAGLLHGGFPNDSSLCRCGVHDGRRRLPFVIRSLVIRPSGFVRA